MQARAISRETNRANDRYVAKSNQTQSTAGFERIEAKDLVDLIQRNETASCTNNKVPQSTISVLTALMDGHHLATEDNLTDVPLSSDDESEGGWSVVSGGSDFVVIDAAETARNISNDRSRKKPEVLPKPSKQARPKHPNAHQQSVVADQKSRKEPVAVSAVHDSSRDHPKHGQQQCDRNKRTTRSVNRQLKSVKDTRQAS